jgi:hypothetical protein
LILKITVTALIANGAIQGMVNKEHLHNALTGLLHHVRFGFNNHTFAARHRAGCHRLRRATFDLNQTHPAIRRNGELVVVTEPRNFYTKLFSSLNNASSLFNFDFDIIDCEFRHFDPLKVLKLLTYFYLIGRM